MLRGIGVKGSDDQAVDVLLRAYQPNPTADDLHHLQGLVASLELPGYNLRPPYEPSAIGRVSKALIEVLFKLTSNNADHPGAPDLPPSPLRNRQKPPAAKVNHRVRFIHKLVLLFGKQRCPSDPPGATTVYGLRETPGNRNPSITFFCLGSMCSPSSPRGSLLISHAKMPSTFSSHENILPGSIFHESPPSGVFYH